MHTFAPGIDGYDALYGFVADSLRGEYRPLNGSGLVVTNPATAPYQTYSWMAFPHQDEVLVQSFLNYFDFEGQSLDDIAEFPASEQHRRFGGTLAPTVRLGVDGDATRVTGTLHHWHIPTETESLPAPERADVPTGAAEGERPDHVSAAESTRSRSDSEGTRSRSASEGTRSQLNYYSD